MGEPSIAVTRACQPVFTASSTSPCGSETPPPTPKEIGRWASAVANGEMTPSQAVARIQGRISNPPTRAVVDAGPASPALERLQILFQIVPLLPRELQIQHSHIVLYHVLEALRAPVVKVWSMLPQAAKRGRAVPLLR